jgi:hypothetical protein
MEVKEEISEKEPINITKPTKGQARKPEWFVFWQPILAQN